MKSLFLALFALLLLSRPVNAATLYPQTTQENKTLETINDSVVGEKIKNFKSDITIQKDGSLNITETIKYYFDSSRHGIFRYIPFTKYDKDKRYDMGFTFKPVVDENGKKYRVTKSKDNEQWVLKIGDPNKTITGLHTYIISYNVRGGLGYFLGHDELYWNITGNGWEVPIQKAEVNITLPGDVSAKNIKLDCFTGGYNSTKHNCTGEINGTKTSIRTTLFLSPGEGLTIVEGFPKDIVAILKPEAYIPFFERWYGKIVLFLLAITALCWYIVLPIWLIVHWYRTGRDPEVGIPLTAAFDPPKSKKRFLTPAETGALIDETVDNRDIFASIVDLARRGYIKIEEREKKDFFLMLNNKPKTKDTLLPFEKKLLEGTFNGNTEIRLKDTKIYTIIADIKKMLYEEMVTNNYFKTNPDTTRKLYHGLGGAGLVTLNLVMAFIAFIFGKNMPKKTIMGAQQANVAKGLKNFLTSQKRQLEFQGEKQMLFEKLLPYAMAFGVEKAWAKRFDKFDLKQPNWYQGYSGSTFNSYIFASSLSNSYSSFSVASTPPSSSSSGFGGGGFSGGGGGGGGGGSW